MIASVHPGPLPSARQFRKPAPSVPASAGFPAYHENRSAGSAGRDTVMFGSEEAKRDLLARINRPVLEPARLDAWLEQFPPEDRPLALKLVEQIDFYSYPELRAHLGDLHRKLLPLLVRDGFISRADGEIRFDKVDFSKAFSAKSGSAIATFYRHANGLREANFHDVADLATNRQPKSDRALVILDDYVASGSQFLEDAYAHGKHRYLDKLLPQYKKVYFATVVAHEDAVKRFDMLKAGNHQAIIDEILGDWDLQQGAAYKNRFKRSIRAVAGGKLELVNLVTELPMLSPRNPRLTEQEKEALRDFLTRHNLYKRPFGIGNKQGHTAFFYNPPNTLPDILWNSKCRKMGPDGKLTDEPFMPLIKRHEDVSIGGHAHFYPPEKQVW